MGYTIRQMEHERNFCQELSVEALQRAVPPEAIRAVLRERGNPVRRARKLTAEATIWVLIALNVYTHLAVGHVLRKVSQGLRFIWPDPTYRVPGASAFVYRHRRGPELVAPVVALYEPPGPAHRHRADAGGIPLRAAPDGARWDRGGCPRQPRQCRRLRAPTR